MKKFYPKQLLTALLLLCCAVATAHDFEVDGIYYNITDATAKTVAVTYKGDSYNSYSNEYSGTVNIPATVTYNGNTYSVTSIRSYAFEYCNSLASIEIPNSITSIGNYAFSGCSRLETIMVDQKNNVYDSRESCNAIIETATNTLIAGCKNTIIPSSVTSVGNGAFSGCSSLESITIPNSVTSIGNSAFRGCSNLASITIPNSVTSIGSGAFEYCSSLASIEIPNSVTSIGSGAFDGCTALKELRIEDSEETLSLGYNVSSSNFTGEGLFYHCPLETLYLGRNLSYESSYNSGYSPFYNKTALTSVTIGDNVTSIGSSAFSGCRSLESITIGNSVTSIGYDAFSGCSSLASIEIPNSVTSIESGAFSRCSSLASITIPNSATSIGNRAFYNCSSLESVTIGNSVTSIGHEAFSDCSSLASITIPNSVTSIGDFAFYDCSSLASITIPNSVTSIGDEAFSGTAWYDAQPDGIIYAGKVLYGYKGTMPANTSIIVKEGTTGIAGSAFYNCSNLASITIPSSVTSIGWGAFNNCSSLASITIPNSVTTIESDTFSGCSSLASITIPNSVTSIGYSAFSGCNSLASITIPNSVTSIGDEAFSGTAWYDAQPDGIIYAGKVLYGYKGTMPANTSIIVKEGTTGIAGSAFYNCSNLASITIPSSVTSIGSSAFYNCSSLASITIPNSVTSIGWGAFNNCSSLASITIPSSVTSIGSSAFSRCSSLASITIPSSVTSIGSSAFSGCRSLEEVHITDIAAWCNIDFSNDDSNPLYYAKNLYLNGELVTDLVIPDDVTAIKNYAFYDCRSLTNVTIPNSVTSIGSSAFSRCSSLKLVLNYSNLTFSKGSTNYGDIAYYANKVINAPAAQVDGDYVWTVSNGVATLSAYLGNDSILTLPSNYNGGNYAIGSQAFYGCSSIKSVTTPNSVTSIGSDAFYNCSSLEEVHITDISAWCNVKFSNSSSNPLYYAKNLYLNGELVTNLVIPTDVTAIKNNAFYGCSSLESITIPNSVTNIGSSAFRDCSSLKTVINYSNLIFTKGYKNNGYIAYYADKVINAPGGSVEGDFVFGIIDGVNTLCEYLGNDTNITLPDNYNGKSYSIGENVFKDYTNITSITIPNSVTSIGSYAFKGCTGLTSITIPNSVTNIGENAFSSCTTLKKLRIEDGESELAVATNSFSGCPLEKLHVGRALHYDASNASNSPFYGKETLENITIGDNVATIGKYMFAGCNALKEIVFGSGVKLIDDYALNGCNSLETIYTLGMRPAIVGIENFATTQFLNVKLNVPNGSLESYQRADIWEKFWEIQEFDVTGIDDTCASTGEPVIYDLRGNRIAEITEPGIYIVNGKKVIY